MNKSKIIVIEGTDGSGKATQTKLLNDALIKKGYTVYTTSFPNYESQSSSLVKMYLSGEISKNANDVSPKAASIFYASDRYITYKKEMKNVYEKGESIILLDRYVSSNILHQGSKIIKEGISKDENTKNLSEIVSWLDNLEHNDLGIPRADIVIYLHVPVEYTIKLRKGRNNKFTGEEKQDIHESDVNHLKNAEMAGNIVSDMLGWKKIECISNEQMRTIEDISEEILNFVEENLK